MKQLAIKTIQAKIVIWTGIPILVVMSALIVFSVIRFRQTAVDAADQQAFAVAQYNASRITAQIEIPLDMARALAQSLAATQAGESHEKLTRIQVNQMLASVLNQNPSFLGVWTVWEANAFDGKDQYYQNTEGTDETGRFVPYWVRGEANSVHMEPLVDYDTLEYYQCPKRLRQECIIDPYLYQIQGKTFMMTTVAVPVVIQGKVVGAVGIDLEINTLQKWADEFSAFQDQAQLRVIAYKGTLVASKGQPTLVSDSIENQRVSQDISKELSRLQNGESFHVDDGTALSFYAPVTFGSTDQNWSLNISIPSSVIYQQADQNLWESIAIGVVLAFIGLLTIWFLALQISRPIVQLTGLANLATQGKFDAQVDIHSDDEVGILADAFGKMIRQVRDMLEKERSQRHFLEETVQEYGDYLNEVAAGNLSRRVKVSDPGGGAEDPLVVLGRSLNNMAASLQRMIQQIRDTSANLNSSSAEILSATSQQASGASEQSAAISETTATVDEVKAIADQSRMRAQEVTHASARTVEVSRVGQQAVSDTITSMNQIKGRVEGIAENILALSEQTQQIGEIIATVNEIAAQSNMLALNASIEAARAGEHGKSFSVVAMEVRSLAEQSRSATVQVKSILSEIQKATNATVMATEEGTKGVERGVQLALQAQQSIEQLSQVIQETSQAASQVSAGSQQQVAGVEQVAMAMQNINQATVQSLSSTRQAEKAAQDLNELARRLNEMVTRYNI